MQAVDLPGIRADDAGEHAAGYSLHAVRGAVLPGDIQRVVFTMIIKAFGVVHLLQQAAAERDIDFLKPAADAEHRNAARKGGADQRQGRGVARRVCGRLRVAQRLAIVVRLDIRRRAGEHQPVHIPQHRIQRQLGAHRRQQPRQHARQRQQRVNIFLRHRIRGVPADRFQIGGDRNARQEGEVGHHQNRIKDQKNKGRSTQACSLF